MHPGRDWQDRRTSDSWSLVGPSWSRRDARSFPRFLWCSAVGTVSVPAGDTGPFANGNSAPDLRESQDRFFIAFQGSCLEKFQDDTPLSQHKKRSVPKRWILCTAWPGGFACFPAGILIWLIFAWGFYLHQFLRSGLLLLNRVFVIQDQCKVQKISSQNQCTTIREGWKLVLQLAQSLMQNNHSAP